MKHNQLIAACALALMSSVAAAGVSVSASATLVDLGSFAAGVYNISATGTVDLVGNGTFAMNPDGTPVTTVTAPNYNYFNPDGSFNADGNYGPAGANAKIGALIGTFSATPLTTTDWFLIGYAKQVTLASAGHIYARVNDTYPPNNTGAFDVTVTAVPEPENYALMLAGLGLVGITALRRRKLDV